MLAGGRYRCEACGKEHAAHEIKVNRRDDHPCPSCGSLRLAQQMGRREHLRRFLIRYNLA